MSGRKQLYQYAILFHPKQTRDSNGNDTTPPDEIVTPITAVLAGSEDEVGIVAARSIPEKYLSQLECIDVSVAPFFPPRP